MKVPDYSPPVAQVRKVQATLEAWEGGDSVELAETILRDLHALTMSRVAYAAAVEFPPGKVFLTGPHSSVLDASKEVKFLHNHHSTPSDPPKARVFVLYPPTYRNPEILTGTCNGCGRALAPGFGASDCGCVVHPVLMEDGSVEIDYHRRCASHGTDEQRAQLGSD